MNKLCAECNKNVHLDYCFVLYDWSKVGCVGGYGRKFLISLPVVPMSVNQRKDFHSRDTVRLVNQIYFINNLS